MKRLKTLENIRPFLPKVVPVVMLIHGEWWRFVFIEQCFSTFPHQCSDSDISCSDIRSLTEFCTEFKYFSQDLTDVIDSAVNSTTSSMYLPALCITVLRDREQPAAQARADKRSVRFLIAQISSIQCRSCK